MGVSRPADIVAENTCLPNGPQCPTRPLGAVVNRLVSYNRCTGRVSTEYEKRGKGILGEARAAERCGGVGGMYPEWTGRRI